MSLAGAAARGAAISLASQAMRFIINLAAIAVLARILAPSDYGTIAAVTAITGVAYLLSDFGLSMASIQSQSITLAQKSNLFWLNVALGSALTVVVYFSSWPIAAFYGDERLVAVTQAMSAMLLLSGLAAQFRAEATKNLRFKALAVTDVLSPLVGFAVALIAAMSDFRYWSLVLQQITQAAVLLVLLIVIARWLPGLPRRRQAMRPLLTFGLNSVGVQLINYVSNNLDSVLIGRFVGASALGYYSRAYQLFRLPLQQLAAPSTRVAFPILSKLNGTPEYDKYIQRAQLVLTYVLGGVFFFAAAASDPLIEIALGPNWDQTKILFAILCIGGVFQSLGYVYYWLFLSKAQTGIQLRFSLIGRGLMIVFLFIGVNWGAVGVAIAMSAGLTLNWILLSAFAVPRTGVAVRPLLATALRPTALYAGMLVVAVPVAIGSHQFGPWLNLGAIIITTALYLTIAYFSVRAVRADVGAIASTVRKIRR